MKTSIYVCYHKPCKIINNQIFKYIYCGAAINGDDNYIQGTLRDDYGENISILNNIFCETTAMYWAWKNDFESDYIGFMHYRRHLNFSEIMYRENTYGLVEFDSIDREYINKFMLDKKTINSTLIGKDMVVQRAFDVVRVPENNPPINMYTQYKYSHDTHIKDLELFLDIIKHKYPYLTDTVNKTMSSTYGYFANCFIMKRSIFNDYCRYLFDVLNETYNEVDYSRYNIQERRFIGYLSEWAFTIFFNFYKKNFDYIELQKSIILNPDGKEYNTEYNKSNNIKYIIKRGICSIIHHSPRIKRFLAACMEENKYEKN